MQIPEVDINYFGTTKERLLRRKVSEFIKEKLVGQKISFSQKRNGINLAIELTWQGLKNDINENHPPYLEKLISFAVLDKILQNAKYIRKEKDKLGRDIIVYKFYSQVIIGSKKFDVIFIIKKTSKTYLYDHILLYIK
jgi:hypothetical protein